jgi:NAD-dependent dihydropyrimidine dehydrogenase PreA subunit
MCPQAAISKKEDGGGFELVIDPDRCIGCGIWNLVKNEPLE